MQAWVIGGSGLVGRSLLELLSAHPRVERVLSVGRRASGRSLPKIEELVVNFDELEGALAGRHATHAFSCLGTTIGVAGSQAAFRRVDFDYPLAFGRAAKAGGATAYLSVSALGADPKSRIFYNRVKGELEQALAELDFSRLDLLRPSLLLGEREQRRSGEGLASAVFRPLTGLMRGPLARYAPIEGHDVARALVTLAARREPGRFVHQSDELKRLAAESP